ncbi:MAG: hypothetical protein GXW99_04465 [Clostridiales bacterium]|nr:hypothetical protein [Clostridiales bacterium]
MIPVDEKKAHFFQHSACEYFPCHKTRDVKNFNCLFCYCPLYMLGDRCGGHFTYTEKGVKNCTGCLLPHGRESWRLIASRFPEISEMAKRHEKK